MLFKNIQVLKIFVDRASEALLTRSSEDYFLSFAHITKEDILQHKIEKHNRMTYFNEYDLLIIKLMPDVQHQKPFSRTRQTNEYEDDQNENAVIRSLRPWAPRECMVRILFKRDRCSLHAHSHKIFW
jgi:hypothetical protein